MLIKSPAWTPCCTHTHTRTHAHTQWTFCHIHTYCHSLSYNKYVLANPLWSLLAHCRQCCVTPLLSPPLPLPLPLWFHFHFLSPPYWCSNSHLIQSKIRMSNFKLWLYLGTRPLSRNRQQAATLGTLYNRGRLLDCCCRRGERGFGVLSWLVRGRRVMLEVAQNKKKIIWKYDANEILWAMRRFIFIIFFFCFRLFSYTSPYTPLVALALHCCKADAQITVN